MEIIAVVVTYIWTPLIVFWGLSLLRHRGAFAVDSLLLLLTAFIIGPFFIYTFLETLVSLLPGRDHSFYVSCVYIVFVGIPALSLVCRRDTLHVVLARKYFHWQSFFLYIVVFLVMSCGWYFLLSLPLKTNDPIQYGQLARILFDGADVSFYPMTKPVEANGFIVYASHPLGYPFAIYWHYLMQNGSIEFGLAKIISLWNGFFASLLVMYLAKDLRLFSVLWAALFFIGTPLLSAGIIYHSVDPLYISLLLLLGTFLVSEEPLAGRPYVLLVGIVTALIWRQHSLGLVSSVLLLGAFLCLKKALFKERMFFVCWVLLIAVLLGGERYIVNWGQFGKPLGDDTLVWGLESVRHLAFLREKLGIQDVTGRIVNGLLMMWTKPLYGVTPWIALLFCPFLYLKIRYERKLILAAWFFFLYMMLNILLVVVGNDVSIRGVRYFLPLIPFLAYVSARGVECVCEFDFFPRVRLGGAVSRSVGGADIIWMVSFLFPLALLGILVLSSLTAGSFVRQDASWFTDEVADEQSFARLVNETSRVVGMRGLVLTFRMDLLSQYSSVRFVRYLDSRLVPFYNEKYVSRAVGSLKRLKVTHVLMPSYELATIQNSLILNVLRDPLYAELLYENNSGSLYSLK